MFESLIVRKERRMAQPVLSFAVHVSLIALAVGQVPPSHQSLGGSREVYEPWVIHDPDAGGGSSEVDPGTESPLPRPRCDCDIEGPGPIEVVGLKGFFEADSGIPGSNPVGNPGRSILNPAPQGDVGVFPEAALTESPILVHFPDPVYPPALKAARVEGGVEVRYVVDVRGGVEPGSIIIVSSDHPYMTESVRTALTQARFQPGRLRGTPVRSLVRQVIRFSLMPL